MQLPSATKVDGTLGRFAALNYFEETYDISIGLAGLRTALKMQRILASLAVLKTV